MSFCQYRDVFGKAREGVHALRVPILDVAAVDLALTCVAGYFIAEWLRVSVWMAIVALLALSLLAHKLFCVNSRLVQMFRPE